MKGIEEFDGLLDGLNNRQGIEDVAELSSMDDFLSGWNSPNASFGLFTCSTIGWALKVGDGALLLLQTARRAMLVKAPDDARKVAASTGEMRRRYKERKDSSGGAGRWRRGLLALPPIPGGFFEVFLVLGENSMWSPGAIDRNSQLLTPPRRFPFSSMKPSFSQQPSDYHRFDGGECRTSQEPDSIVVSSP
ncbi:hypothetical protein Droror1_Dr00009770 [Drosera rotundifolia]